jgi:hypothetical protein
MKRRFTLLPAAFLAAMSMMLIFPGASAQNLDAARANIPFAFVANHVVLPAGCYKVELLSNTILGLINCETGKTVGVMVHAAMGYPTIRRGSMVFQVTGTRYRLIHVGFPATNIQSDLLVQPKPEKELAWDAPSKTTEIALK